MMPSATILQLSVKPKAETGAIPSINIFERARRRTSTQEDVGNKAAATLPTEAEKGLSALARLRARVTQQAQAANLPFPSDDEDRKPRLNNESSLKSLQTIEGELTSVKVYTSWAVGTMISSEGEELKISGAALCDLREGLNYRFKGLPTHHATHGEGFDVVSCEPTISEDAGAIEKFLVKTFDGIGPAKAAKYVAGVREKGDTAIAELKNTLLNAPWSLDLTSIAKGAKFAGGEDAHAKAKTLIVARNLSMRLGVLGVARENMLEPLAVFLLHAVASQTPQNPDVSDATWRSLTSNPYAPITRVVGYGFMAAEAIATMAGLPKDSPFRLKALVEYAVSQSCNRRGHVYLEPEGFMAAIQKIDPAASKYAQTALAQAAEAKLVVLDGKKVYPADLYEEEVAVATQVAKLLQPSEPLTTRSAEDVRKKLKASAANINPSFAKGFDDVQLNSVASILTSPQRLHVITGGPGTGKTALLEAMLFLLKKKSFVFCAPTGKAAKVMSNRVSRFGYAASTIHSTLKGSEESGFMVNEDEPLSCDVLVVDEGTMLGLTIASALLKALPPDAHLIVMGDPGTEDTEKTEQRAGQLPSIAPGRFMLDLLKLPEVNHAHLIKTHRNSGGILDVVNEIATGQLAVNDRASVRFTKTLEEPAIGFPVLMNNYLQSVAKHGVENTLLIMPLRKGDADTPGWNATFANNALRQACNPMGEKLPGTKLRMGDRIIILNNMEIEQPSGESVGLQRRQNKPEKIDFLSLIGGSGRGAFDDDDDVGFDDVVIKERVVNGDTGMIVGYTMPGKSSRLGSPVWVRLALDDGREIEYPGTALEFINHAYALTIHSAQGSEYKNTLMVVTPGSADFMNQNMLLTGASRAKEGLEIYGDTSVLINISNTPAPVRNSALPQRVLEAIAQEKQAAQSVEFEDTQPCEP